MVGHTLSLKTGIPLDQLLKDTIWNVLGMNSTGFAMNATGISVPANIVSKFAKGHTVGNESELIFLSQEVQGAGAMYSTVNDLLKYVSANMGLSWFSTTDLGNQVIWHNGGIDGYSSFVGFNPDKQIGLIILCSCYFTDVPPIEMLDIAVPFLLFYHNS